MSGRQVFINCPFSADYQDHFRAIVFTVLRSGYTPRCARENDDGAEIRFDKICRIIADCDYGVHDISKTELDPDSRLPRFNMPLELGLFLGAKKYGGKKHRAKNALILDREAFRYQKFISDIAGQDIHAHDGDVAKLIGEVATWLRDAAPQNGVPGGKAIAAEYDAFLIDLPSLCGDKQLDPAELTFKDVTLLAAAWLVATGKPAL